MYILKLQNKLAIILLGLLGLLGLTMLKTQNGLASDNTLSSSLIGKTEAGGNIVTYKGVETEFKGYAVCPDACVIKYTWDFDDDGTVDWVSSTGGISTHIFSEAGEYHAVFRAYDDNGRQLPISIVKVMVKEGEGRSEVIDSEHTQILELEKESLKISKLPADGISKRYVLIINGASEERFWEDIEYLYDLLLDLDIPDQDIYLLHYNGKPPEGIYFRHGDKIDYAANRKNVELVCEELARIIDADDILYVWIDDHGRGYSGPHDTYFGYLDGKASVDPGDEQDCREKDFKLRSLATYGNYYCNHGMGVWKVYKKGETYFRHKYVSYFKEVYFKEMGVISNDDIYIEEFIDYLNGDIDKDSKISKGEVFDFDGDGILPYDYISDTFDEDDWGEIDTFKVIKSINTLVPEGFGGKYCILDLGFDNRLDIDLDHDPENPQSNGTDEDNNGLFDGMDINDDKDMEDWVSIDEMVCLFAGDLSDDEFKQLLEPIGAQYIVLIMEPCHSGGFIEDLSASNRIILTATEEDALSYGNMFIRNVFSAFSKKNYPGATWTNPLLADVDNNGYVDMAEAFNFASVNDIYSEIPQYDDNGDGRPSLAPLPYGGDGILGSTVFITGNIQPYFDPVPDKEIHEGSLLSFYVTATDLNKDELMYYAALGESGEFVSSIGADFTSVFLSDRKAGLFTWMPDKYQGKKDYPIIFSVTDNKSETVRVKVVITVLIPGDFDADGDVDGTDLAVFAAEFGQTDCHENRSCKSDFDNDSDVDGTDLILFANNFGRTKNLK